MPVSTAMAAGMWAWGFTRVCSSPVTSPARTLTAPNSVMQLSSAPPVVSRSTTQNVTSDRWVPASTSTGWLLMADTLPPGSDRFSNGCTTRRRRVRKS